MDHAPTEHTTPSDRSHETPDTIGPYRVLRPVAKGGMATVYEVVAPHNHERRALKVLHSTSESARLRFYREYEALCRLNHPNIVRAYVFGEWNGMPWYTMEYLTGVTVQSYAKTLGAPGNPERTQAVIQIGHDLMSALAHIHKWGIVHRDLKAANVVVLPNGKAKLVDFGTAAVRNPIAHIPEDGEFVGTYTYASPEQFSGMPVDHRSDLYSGGVLLYRLTTGKLPFTGTDPEHLGRQHLSATATAPKAFVTDIPARLSDLIMGLLTKEPSGRPQSAEQVCRLLTGLVASSAPPPVDLRAQPTRAIGQESNLFTIQDFLRLPTTRRKPGTPSTLALFGVSGSGRRELLETAMSRTPVDPPVLRFAFHRTQPASDTVAAALTGHALENAPTKQSDLVAWTASIAAAHSEQYADALTVVAHQPSDAGDEAISFVRSLVERAAEDPSQLRVLIAAQPTQKTHFTDASVLCVDTTPISVRGVRRLTANLTHQRPPPEPLAVWLHQRTGGLPGHVRQLVHALYQQGFGEVGAPGAWPEPPDDNYASVVLTTKREAADLRALTPQQRLVVATLAVLGGVLDLDSLRGTLGLSNSVLAPCLHQLKEGLWLEWSRNANGAAIVALCSHRLPHLILNAVGSDASSQLKEQLAKTLPVRGASEHGLKWLLRHAPTRVSPAEARQWAMPLRKNHRPHDIVHGLEPFINAHDDLTMTEEGRELLMIYVQALMVSRPTDPKLGAWFRKLETCAAEAPPKYRLSLHLLNARLQQVIGHVTNTRKHLAHAWQVHERSPSPRVAARVATANAWHAHQEGNADHAAKWHGRARRLAREARCSTTIAHAELGVATWQLSQGRMGEAERTCATLLDSKGTLHDPGLHGRTLSVWSHSLRQQGRLSEALHRLWHEILPLERAQAPTGYIYSLLATAWCELELGRLGSAQEHLDDIAASISRDTHLILRVEAGLLQGRLLTASGNARDAVPSISDVQTRAERGSLSLYGAVASAYRAEALWMTGKHKMAQSLFDRALETLLPIGDMPRLAEVCRARARVMAEEVPPDELFAPLRRWIDQQPALLARLSEAVAFGEYHSKRGLLSDGSDWIEAAATLHDLEACLANEEQAALRIHPWSRVSRAFG